MGFRLGKLVHKKTATAVAFTATRPEDRNSLNTLIDAVKTNYLDRYDEVIIIIIFIYLFIYLFIYFFRLRNIGVVASWEQRRKLVFRVWRKSK